MSRIEQTKLQKAITSILLLLHFFRKFVTV